MQGLNPPQRQAVIHTEGPLLVLAGAGSGKTKVIVEKIAHLVSTGRYPARRIAAITFTNKSAKEMRERVARRLKGDAGEGLTISTFHALGLKIVQVDGAKLGLKRGFSVFDADDSIPRVCWGRYTPGGGGRWSVAVALQVHHGLLDGAHVAQFFAAMQAAADQFQTVP